jgi:hypothetical protein
VAVAQRAKRLGNAFGAIFLAEINRGVALDARHCKFLGAGVIKNIGIFIVSIFIRFLLSQNNLPFGTNSYLFQFKTVLAQLYKQANPL